MKASLECFERGLTRVGPDKWCLLAGESGEGYDDFGVILDEASVEVGESEERLDFLDGTRDWPVSNDAGFSGSIVTPEGETMNPRYSMVSVWKCFVETGREDCCRGGVGGRCGHVSCDLLGCRKR